MDIDIEYWIKDSVLRFEHFITNQIVEEQWANFDPMKNDSIKNKFNRFLMVLISATRKETGNSYLKDLQKNLELIRNGDEPYFPSVKNLATDEERITRLATQIKESKKLSIQRYVKKVNYDEKFIYVHLRSIPEEKIIKHFITIFYSHTKDNIAKETMDRIAHEMRPMRNKYYNLDLGRNQND